jgi:hypothetical protein
MTLSGGDLGLYGKNGWAAKGIPDAMSNKLYQLHDDGQLIDDVALTEDGSWFILYGDNGYSSEDAPSGLGNVPDGLKEKLQTTTMDVFRIVGCVQDRLPQRRVLFHRGQTGALRLSYVAFRSAHQYSQARRSAHQYSPGRQRAVKAAVEPVRIVDRPCPRLLDR